MPSPSRSIAFGVFTIALATLLFEVAITRIFAVTLWYHFGFLAISLALVGTTAAAVCCFVWFERLVERRHHRNLAMSAVAFALLLPLATWFHLDSQLDKWNITGERFYLVLGTQIGLFFSCFFAAGLCVSIALARYGASIGKLYCFDLLGAALGTVLLAPLLYHFSPLAICFLASAAALLAAWLFLAPAAAVQPAVSQPVPAKRTWFSSPLPGQLALGAGLALAVTLFFFNDSWGVLQITRVKSHAPDRLQQVERKKLHEQWSPLGRIAVFKTSDPNRLRVTNDGAAPTSLHRFSGDFQEFAYLLRDFREIVHHVKPQARTLIIGSAGGKDVLAALAADQPEVTAVEINPVTAELVTERFADYTGRLFHHLRVKFHVAEGRNFVARSSDRFDIIQISMIDSWQGASGGYIFNENNLYTCEAIDDYLSHLSAGGVLSITRYYKYDEVLRLVNVMLDSLERSGVENPGGQLLVVLENGSRERATVLLKNGRFDRAEIERFTQAAGSGKNLLVHVPGLPSSSLHQDEIATALRSLIDPPAYGAASREAVVASYPKNISVSTDDHPFFFFTLRLGDVFDPDLTSHGARRMALPLLYGSFLALTLVALATILLPLTLSRKCKLTAAPCRLRMLLFFACLGLGFMLVEMALIHRITVFLGYPSYALMVVLSTLLSAGGLGSLTAGRLFPQVRPRQLLIVLTAVTAVLSLLAMVVVDRLAGAMWLSDLRRIVLAVTVMAVPGFLMGMCLPLGMQIAKSLHPRLIPWGWGVNGAFSVLGSSLALVVALHLGLKATLICGAACYGVAWFIIASLNLGKHRLSRSDDANSIAAVPSEKAAEDLADEWIRQLSPASPVLDPHAVKGPGHPVASVRASRTEN